MGLTPGRLSARLNGKKHFGGDEIALACQLLNIPDEEIGIYFFQPKFDKSN